MKGVIIDKGEKYFTFIRKIFLSLDNIEKNYNWLITGHECYPRHAKYAKLLSNKCCWITGEMFSEMVSHEDFQWIWGVFSAFNKNILQEDVLKYKLPQANGYKKLWKNPVSIQHPLAEIEIIAWDSALTVLISKNDSIANELMKKNPLAKDLETYNNHIIR